MIICLYVLHPDKIIGSLLTFASNLESRTGPCSDQALSQLLFGCEVAIFVDSDAERKNL